MQGRKGHLLLVECGHGSLYWKGQTKPLDVLYFHRTSATPMTLPLCHLLKTLQAPLSDFLILL